MLDLKKLKNLFFYSSLTLTLTTGLSYILGLVRDKSLAYTFGAGSDLDIYNAGFVLPDFLFAVLVSGAIAAAFVPIFTGLDEKDKNKAIVYTNQVLNWGLLVLGLVSILAVLLLPLFAEFLVPGFNASQLKQYILVTRLMLINPIILVISNCFGSALLSLKKFLWYGLAPVMYNLGIIFGIFVFVPYFGLIGLVLGTILGALLHLFIRLPEMLIYGFRPRLNLVLSGEIRETIVLMLPKMTQIGMWHVLLWWFIRLASQVREGGVTTYAFARNFQSVPVGLIGMAIALATFSKLSHLAAQNRYKEFFKIVKKKALSIFFITSLAAVGLAVFSQLIIGLLLGGGEFGEKAVSATAALLTVYCLAVPLESLMHLLARAHYALKDTFRPASIHVVAIVLTMLISSLLLAKVGLYAIPISFALGLVFQISLLIFSLWQIKRTCLGQSKQAMVR